MFELVAKGGKTFPVPLAILTAAQSEPLRRATTGPWLESQKRTIDLQEWDADTVNQLVSFLYRGTYEGPPRASRPIASRACLRSGWWSCLAMRSLSISGWMCCLLSVRGWMGWNRSCGWRGPRRRRRGGRRRRRLRG